MTDTFVWSVMIIGLVGFAAIAYLVSTDATTVFDHSVMSYFIELGETVSPLGPPWVEEIFLELTALGGGTVLTLVALLVLVGLFITHQRGAALTLIATLFSGTIIPYGLKFLFDRPRPDLVAHLDRTFTASFPSAHATVSMIYWISIATIIARFIDHASLRRFIYYSAFSLVIVIGLSRIYLGVHWPSDVIAGWLLGLSWAAFCWLLANRFAIDKSP
ncbi:phosphatase PAP2 family protein [uncultured Cohaesibacter sp.]|uniref:phosphatase PAP2 family protein n=1 Tax=uncultured Cohaesibacter sp. TaxID=1002546 RepID=UPI0037479CB7